MSKALVVLSGGQDSMTVFGLVAEKHGTKNMIAISYQYGQKHAVEIAAARQLCVDYEVEHIVINLTPILENMRSSALITHGDTAAAHPILKNLPASFVPARNALFLTAAYGLAIEHGCSWIYTGVCQTDYSGYPDCRDIFVEALNKALNVGYESNISIETPLMFLTKAETFKLAQDVHILEYVLRYSVTCYNGNIKMRNEWGLGCGGCPACRLRMKGYEEFKEAHIIPGEHDDGIEALTQPITHRDGW